MKKKLPRILGVVLTVVLLVSLFAFAVPVSAGTLYWSAVGTPSLTSNVLVGADEELGPVAMSPNFGTDKTVFAAINDLGPDETATATVTTVLAGGSNTVAETFAITYTNQNGTASRTGSVTLAENAAATTTAAVTLQAGDSGIQDITGIAATASDVTSGLITITGDTSATVLATWTVTGAGTGTFATGAVVPAGTGEARVVYKSTDGGHTWVPTASLGVAGDSIIALEVSPNYVSDNTVFVVTQLPAGGIGSGRVYRSTDGGATFSQLGVVTLGAGEVITSMAVSPNYDGVGIIAVGIADNADSVAPATAATSVQLWGTTGILNWTNYGSTTAWDVVAIAFSPNYPIDATLLVVASAASTQPFLHANVGGVWDTAILATAVGASAVDDYDALAGGTADDILAADIALPSDYTGTTGTLRRAYVAIVSEATVSTTTGNVYRITTQDGVNAGVATSPGVELSNLAYAGTFATGTLVGGLYGAAGAADVYYTTNPEGTIVYWYASTNPPTGTTLAAGTRAYVAIDTNFATSSTVVAGTVGTDSAFAVSTDGAVSWNETGLIDNGGVSLTVLGDVVLSPDYATDSTIFLLSNDSCGGTPDTSIWRSTDAGVTWTRLGIQDAVTAGVGVIALSQDYATNGVLYVGDTGSRNVYYSADRGNAWSTRTIATAIGVTIGDMVATDATTLFVADAVGGNVAKSTNSGWVWSATNTVATGSTGNLTSIAVEGDTLVVGDSTGTVFRSDDAGAIWAKVGATILTGQNVFADVDGDYVYAVLGNGDVYRFQTGVSVTWYSMTTTPTVGAGIAIADDSTLYVLDSAATADQQVYRTIKPTWGPTPDVPPFEWMAGLSAVAGGALSLVSSDSSNTLAIVEGTTPGMWIFSDTLSAGSPGPTLVGPDDGYMTAVARDVSFKVENVTGVTEWTIAYSTDPNFNDDYNSIAQTAPATYAWVALGSDWPYYWMARAASGSPLRGPWSEVRIVYPQLVSTINAPVLVQPLGATAVDVQINPVFNWTPLKNATGYDLQVARDAAFTDLIVDEAVGNVTSYYLADALDYSTAYFWKVRATTAATATDWSAGTGFITVAAPVEPAPPVVIEPVPPAPTPQVIIPAATPITPGWIYAIIIVGAVLVIAVIVLIVRTRRVV